MKISRKKLIAVVLTCMIFTLMMSTTTFATGDVAGAVEGTWNEALLMIQ